MTAILALDLASVSGWAVGDPDHLLASGSVRFAKRGSSHEAMFVRAFDWAHEQIITYSPKMLVWEAPLSTSFARGKTTLDTTTVLFGLPAVIGTAAFKCGLYDIRKATTRDVRMHFIGQNPKRALGKALTMRQCRAMGIDVEDDNEADAIALWHYMCGLIRPELAVRPTPLFGRGALR